MKKILFLMLSLLLWSAANVVAQVRIGGTGDPQEAAVLDLNADNNATPTGNKGALALPRVSLTAVDAMLNSTTPLNGMMVYHTGTALDGAGIYVWTGGASGKWTKVNSGLVPVITDQPAKFSFKRLQDTDGDPNGLTAANAAVILTVTATNATAYQWYKKAINENAPDTLISGATSASYTFTPKGTGKDNWGLNKFYCIVSNDYGSVKSEVAEVAHGCGAKTVSGGWLKFMCYNLGATDRTKDPFTWAGPASSDTAILGKFYQWGRNAAAHLVNNTVDSTNFTKTFYYPHDWRIRFGYTRPLADNYRQDDYLWRNFKNSAHDPCPDGWHVPAQSAFSAIFKGTADVDIPANATANTWTPTGTFAEGTGNGGYAIKPDGSTTTLFFPAVGHRNANDGQVYAIGLYGRYWSSTPTNTGVPNLSFSKGSVLPSSLYHRGNGLSVRCISE